MAKVLIDFVLTAFSQLPVAVLQRRFDVRKLESPHDGRATIRLHPVLKPWAIRKRVEGSGLFYGKGIGTGPDEMTGGALFGSEKIALEQSRTCVRATTVCLCKPRINSREGTRERESARAVRPHSLFWRAPGRRGMAWGFLYCPIVWAATPPVYRT